ncbi:MAG: vitamin K epoxide reductase family protein [Balneolaceae bacterium]
MEKTITEYVSLLHIPLSKKNCEKLIASHPDYPSLLSVADVMERLGIHFTVARTDPKRKESLPFPCLLHLDTYGGEFLLVKDEKELHHKKEKLKHWSGVFAKAEPVDNIRDQAHKEALNDERRFRRMVFAGLASTIGLVMLSLFGSFTWILAFLLVTSSAGVITGYLLFARDLGITYKAIETFCNAGNLAGCSKVTSAREGEFFGIKFTDAGFIFFVAQLVLISFFLLPSTAGGNYLTALFYLSALSIPIVFYSIWLQAVTIKTWCRLCLVVSIILVLQAGILFFLAGNGMIDPGALTLTTVLSTILIFTVTGSAVYILKYIIQEKNRAVAEETGANRIKYSPEIFKYLLTKGKKTNLSSFKHEFLVGRPDASVNVMMAVNLYCEPCKTELENAWYLLSIYPEKVNVTLRFLRSGDNGHTSNYLLGYWLENSNGAGSETVGEQSLIREWYETMDLKVFKTSRPNKKNTVSSNGKPDPAIQAHYDWIKKAGIKKTPTTFINGYELPGQYRVKDLIPMIPGLVDLMVDKEISVMRHSEATSSKV